MSKYIYILNFCFAKTVDFNDNLFISLDLFFVSNEHISILYTWKYLKHIRIRLHTNLYTLEEVKGKDGYKKAGKVWVEIRSTVHINRMKKWV